MRKRIRWMIVAACCALSAIAYHGAARAVKVEVQMGGSDISVIATVKGDKGNLSGVRAQLIHKQTGKKIERASTANGLLTFEGIDAGTYSLMVYAPKGMMPHMVRPPSNVITTFGADAQPPFQSYVLYRELEFRDVGQYMIQTVCQFRKDVQASGTIPYAAGNTLSLEKQDTSGRYRLYKRQTMPGTAEGKGSFRFRELEDGKYRLSWTGKAPSTNRLILQAANATKAQVLPVRAAGNTLHAVFSVQNASVTIR